MLADYSRTRPCVQVTNMGTAVWAHIWTASIHDLVFEGNFHDTAALLNKGTNITMRDNELITDAAIPAKAKALMQAAGPVDSPWPSHLWK